MAIPGTLSHELAAELAQVPKSTDGQLEYAPCRVTLHSGEVRDRVYVVEETQFRRRWGRTSATISIDDVSKIEESPFRLAADLANKIYAAGESGMGYTMFLARLSDGSNHPFVVGNAVDFPNWPPGVDPRAVVDVRPGVGSPEFRHRAPDPYERSANFEWCHFKA